MGRDLGMPSYSHFTPKELFHLYWKGKGVHKYTHQLGSDECILDSGKLRPCPPPHAFLEAEKEWDVFPRPPHAPFGDFGKQPEASLLPNISDARTREGNASSSSVPCLPSRC